MLESSLHTISMADAIAKMDSQVEAGMSVLTWSQKEQYGKDHNKLCEIYRIKKAAWLAGHITAADSPSRTIALVEAAKLFSLSGYSDISYVAQREGHIMALKAIALSNGIWPPDIYFY